MAKINSDQFYPESIVTPEIIEGQKLRNSIRNAQLDSQKLDVFPKHSVLKKALRTLNEIKVKYTTKRPRIHKFICLGCQNKRETVKMKRLRDGFCSICRRTAPVKNQLPLEL